MIKIKHLVAVMALAASGVASAASYSYGDLSLDPDYTVDGVINVPLNLLTPFDDFHFYSVSLPSIGSGTLSNTIVFNPDFSFRKVIAGMSAFLWVDMGTVGVHDAGDVKLFELGTSPLGTKTATYITDVGPLASGNYFIEVTGYGAGTQGGTYTFSASAVPVPEAETWAMMGLGLGLVGLQLRRRKSAELIA